MALLPRNPPRPFDPAATLALSGVSEIAPAAVLGGDGGTRPSDKSRPTTPSLGFVATVTGRREDGDGAAAETLPPAALVLDGVVDSLVTVRRSSPLVVAAVAAVAAAVLGFAPSRA